MSEILTQPTILTGELLITPFNFTQIDQLIIERNLNDHGRVYISGRIAVTDNEREKLGLNITKHPNQTPINIVFLDKTKGQKERLFSGVLVNLKVRTDKIAHFIELEAISHTYKLDVKLMKKSYQNINQTYSQIIEKYAKNHNAEIINVAAQETKLQEFTFQYRETDWEFLKRLASRFNSSLVVDIQMDKPRFWFGFPKEREKAELRLIGKIIDCRSGVKEQVYQNLEEDSTTEEMNEERHLHFIMESRNRLLPGDEIILENGASLYVLQARSLIRGNILIFHYHLVPKGAIVTQKIYNTNIEGVTVSGKVVEIEREQVKINIYTDGARQPKNEEAYLFHYATNYTAAGKTGWYSMPEKGDNVKLYFPTNNESEAFIRDGVRDKTKKSNKLSDPSIKYFRTKSGKELKFSGEEVVITSGENNQTQIRLNKKTGMEISGVGKITLRGSNKIRFKAGGKVRIKAKEKIDFNASSSGVELTGKTFLNGAAIKI
jgi:hypothetical protein